MDSKTKIIFVDDEPNILSGLRRMLRSQRAEWDMTFVPGGQEALDVLREKTMDVIVSDMRMPGIDGAQLLNEVKQKYPHMVRIALSGQTSKDAIMRSVGPIHQYIPKPCDAENLIKIIKHACGSRDLLTNANLQDLISQLETLPCLSTFYTSLLEELQNEDASIDKVAAIICKDMSMSLKILQMVNSAFFGVRRHVADIKQAVTLLGLEIIKALMLSTKIFNQFDKDKSNEAFLASLWNHSLSVGELARYIARQENVEPVFIDHALLAGMLHDIGKLVLIAKLPQEYQKVLAVQHEENLTSSDAEKKVFGATHAEIGAYLLGLWGFANTIIEALTFHHRPAQAYTQEFSVLTVVHVADIFARKLNTEDGVAEDMLPEDNAYLEKLGLSERLPQWWQLCRESHREMCRN